MNFRVPWDKKRLDWWLTPQQGLCCGDTIQWVKEINMVIFFWFCAMCIAGSQKGGQHTKSNQLENVQFCSWRNVFFFVLFNIRTFVDAARHHKIGLSKQVFLDKPIVAQLVRKFEFYIHLKKFISVFTKVQNRILSWFRLNHSISSTVLLSNTLNLLLSVHLYVYQIVFPSDFSTSVLYLFLISYAFFMSSPRFLITHTKA